MQCLVCDASIDNVHELLSCVKCKGPFHYTCLGITSDYYKANRKDSLLSWACHSCTLLTQRMQKGDKTLDQSQGTYVERDLNMSCDDISPAAPREVNRSIQYPSLEQIAELFDSRLDRATSKMKADFLSVCDELRQDFTETAERLSSQLVNIRSELSAVTNRVLQLEQENTQLKSDLLNVTKCAPVTSLQETISKLQLDLNDKDQATLLNDIEISGIPEFENEVPVHLVTAIAAKLGMNMEDRDIVHTARVGQKKVHIEGVHLRPRPLVVSFTRRVIRDEFIKSARVRRGATTANLGLPSHKPTRFHLPPPPHIELVMSMPYLRTAFKRPTVRVRPTSSEMYNRSGRNAAGALDGRGLVAVIKRQVPLAGQLDHQLAWGQGWGWVTLPNGVWSGRLTWSQEGEDFALHAMPVMHHTNVSEACSMLDGVTAYEASAYDQALAEYDDAATTDDWDFGVDCGDFMM